MTAYQDYLAERLRFIGIDDAARAHLREMRPLVEAALPKVLDRFYAHLAGFPAVARFFAERTRAEGAKSAQLTHWRTILSGDYSASYVESCRRVGRTHARIGLEPRWYIAGYALIAEGVTGAMLAAAQPKGPFGKMETEKTAALLSAFQKAMLLDMDFAISIYLEESEAARKRMAHELADQFEKEVSGIVSGVASAATELEHTARALESGAKRVSDQAGVGATAASETNQNVSGAAAAANQMGQAISEIARQAGQSAKVAREAADRANAAGATVETLAAAGERIGQVVRLISDVASKTNLLALNATIEAARAGAAGRGFAVVASEVKALADQTAKATDEISQQIGAIQAVTGDAVATIGAIQRTIEAIDQSSTAISAAVEEQSASTQEIVRTTADAASGAAGLTRCIGDVQMGAGETGAAASQVVSASEELARQAEALRAQAARFLTQVRAA